MKRIIWLLVLLMLSGVNCWAEYDSRNGETIPDTCNTSQNCLDLAYLTSSPEKTNRFLLTAVILQLAEMNGRLEDIQKKGSVK